MKRCGFSSQASGAENLCHVAILQASKCGVMNGVPGFCSLEFGKVLRNGLLGSYLVADLCANYNTALGDRTKALYATKTNANCKTQTVSYVSRVVGYYEGVQPLP